MCAPFFSPQKTGGLERNLHESRINTTNIFAVYSQRYCLITDYIRAKNMQIKKRVMKCLCLHTTTAFKYEVYHISRVIVVVNRESSCTLDWVRIQLSDGKCT